MKKLLIILVLLAFKITLAQVYPLAYKINPNTYSKFKPDYNHSDNINKVLGRYTAAPVSSPTIISNFISDIIVVSSSAGDTIWFGTGKGISRTTNRGASFENFYGTEPFKDDDVSGIAIYRNWVVVSTAYSQIVNEEHVPTGTGIKVSSDYGETWAAYPQPVDPMDSAVTGTYTRYGNNLIHGLAIVVEEQNLSYDINITRKNTTSDSLVFWIASWAGGIRKSTDFGSSWQRVITPPDILDSIYPGGTYNFEYNPRDNGNHKGFAVTSINDSTIFAGTSGGINVSTDWGVSWKKYRYGNTGSGTGITGNFVVGLKVQRFTNKIIVWGATNPGEGESNNGGQFSGISYTTNAGLNWANTLEGAFSHNMGFKDSIVYAATDDGIWRSYFNPNGFNWSKPSIIYDESIRDQIRTNFFYSVSGQGDSVWVGSGDGLARTVDILASPWVSKWKIFRAFQNFTSTNETYAAPNPFSPDDEVCRIYYKTGKTSSNITIKIFNFAMEPVRTVIQNASRTSPDVLWATWDGKRNDGSQVVNGVYFYRIEIDKDETVWGKILVLQ